MLHKSKGFIGISSNNNFASELDSNSRKFILSSLYTTGNEKDIIVISFPIYKVKRGDTLGQIAENFKTRASKIRRWNNMKYGSHLIRPGQKLVIWVK